MSQRCPSCGAFLKKNAVSCSRCRTPAGKPERKKKSLLPILLGLADLSLLAWILQSYLSSK